MARIALAGRRATSPAKRETKRNGWRCRGQLLDISMCWKWPTYRPLLPPRPASFVWAFTSVFLFLPLLPVVVAFRTGSERTLVGRQRSKKYHYSGRRRPLSSAAYRHGCRLRGDAPSRGFGRLEDKEENRQPLSCSQFPPLRMRTKEPTSSGTVSTDLRKTLLLCIGRRKQQL